MQVKTVYRASDRSNSSEPEKPGEHPFTRGIYRNMYRGRLWTMRQYAGFGTARESNERFRYLLENGQTGLSVAFDLPTQMGLDPDHALAAGEVGRVGVSVFSIRDVDTLLEGIPLERVSISMTINSTAAILLAMVLGVARRRAIPWSSLRGTLQNDILKEYIARGTYIYPPSPSLRITTDIISYCREHVPRWNPISISGYHIREAGSTGAQEVAFTIGNAITYVEKARAAGLAVDDFAGKISFFFNAHNGFLEEVAKFRAARRLWAATMQTRFGARNPESCAMRFHTQTAGSALTAQQPENNIVRVAIQALAAVLGGTQSLHTNSLDEALALPSETAARTALRTQQIIACESGVANTADPLGGSYAIEAMTDAIESRASEYLREIDRMGGMLRAIESGYVQREIQEAAFAHQKRLEAGESVTVGVNRFAEEEDRSITTLVLDESVGNGQRAALNELRRTRDFDAVSQSLSALRRSAAGTGDLVAPIVRAVETEATVGEISDCLRDVFGEHRETITI